MPQVVNVPSEDEALQDLVDQVTGAIILLTAVQAAADILNQVSEAGTQSRLWANHAFSSVNVAKINLQTLLEDIARAKK